MEVADVLMWEGLSAPLRRPVMVLALTGWFDAAGVATAAIEHLIEHEPGEGKELLRTLPKPPTVANSATQHRLNARWWTCTSKAQPSLRRIALREAIAQHRAAGCPRAAKVLETQLHLLL